MELEQKQDLQRALSLYAPAPNAIKENWQSDIDGNAEMWGEWLDEYEDGGSYTLPGVQAVWTEGEVVKCVRYALKNLPKERLVDNGLYDRGKQRTMPISVYAGRITDETTDMLVQVADVVNCVSEILSDTLSGARPLSESCREHSMNYIRFRRFCEKFLQVRDGGRSPTGFMPEYEPTFEESFYAMVFGIPAEEASMIMPEDAEETVEYIMSTMDEKEADIIKRRIAKETLISIGEAYGVSRERIRQIEAKTIRKLHNPSRVRMLKQGKAAVGEEEVRRKMEMERIAEAKARLVEEQNRLAIEAASRIENLDIENLDPSVRLYNCLKRAEINTIGDLLKWDRSSLSKLRNMGKKSLAELERLLDSVGLRLEAKHD